MLRIPTLAVTTRHSPSLYPWQVHQGLPTLGPLIGVDVLGGGAPFTCDPWELYAADIISSPNMLVLGQIGTGKSALVKTYLRRQLLAGRRAAVLDPKGEYAFLADRAGLDHIALAPGGRARINPLDIAADRSPDDASRTRTDLIAALATTALERPLSSDEHLGLAAATTGLTGSATLRDVVDQLEQPSQQLASVLTCTAQQARGSLRPVMLGLRRLVDGDLAGMLDAPSTTRPDESRRGVVVDLSAVFSTHRLPVVMTCVAAWLGQLITPTATQRTIFVLDEAWALLHQAATARWLQATAKLARSHGVQLMLVTHRVSDLTAQADAGTAPERQALGLLADTELRVLHRQAE